LVGLAGKKKGGEKQNQKTLQNSQKGGFPAINHGIRGKGLGRDDLLAGQKGTSGGEKENGFKVKRKPGTVNRDSQEGSAPDERGKSWGPLGRRGKKQKTHRKKKRNNI